MDIKIVGPTPTETENLEQRDSQSIESPSNMDQIAIKQVLEIEGDKYSNELETLLEWAKTQVKDDDPISLKWAIRDLRMRIGTPTHEDAVKHLARFAYLDLEEKRIKREKESFR